MWRKSHTLTLAVYRETNDFPAHEQYGLVSRMRRSAASVPANIAEGCGRSSDADLARFLHIGLGSASELQYLILLAHDLSYLQAPVYRQLDGATVEIKRMLYSFIKSLRRRS